MRLWLEDNLASRKALLHRALLFSGVTLFVLFLFQPFGTQNDLMAYKYLRLSGYGLVTFCALLIAGVLEIALSYRSLNPRIRQVLIVGLYIGLVAVFNHSYFVVAILGSWHWQNQMLFVFYTLAIGLFPIGFMFFANRHGANLSRSQQFGQTSEQIEKNHEANAIKPAEIQIITLTGENKGDHIHIALCQLLWIKSADNYCELSLLENNHLNHKLLRCSLTNLLKQLPNNSPVYRCHRSYAVNLSLVAASTGNAAGLQLSMHSSDMVVPVSRSYVDVIKQALLITPKAC